jgi:hypothetical protein
VGEMEELEIHVNKVRSKTKRSKMQKKKGLCMENVRKEIIGSYKRL